MPIPLYMAALMLQWLGPGSLILCPSLKMAANLCPGDQVTSLLGVQDAVPTEGQPQVLSFNILRSSSPTHSPPFTSQVRAPGQEAERKVVSKSFQCIFHVHSYSCSEKNSTDWRASPLTGACPGWGISPGTAR